MWSVLAQAPVPAPRLAGLTVGLLDAAALGRRARPPREPRGRAVRRAARAARRARRRGGDPGAARPTRGRSSSTRRPSRTARPSPRAPTSTATTSARSSSCAGRDAGGGRAWPARPSRQWREYRPPVDLYVAPGARRRPLPPEDCDELEVRLAADRVPAAVQRARLGRDRDRRPAARRAERRGRARGRPRLGTGLRRDVGRVGRRRQPERRPARRSPSRSRRR